MLLGSYLITVGIGTERITRNISTCLLSFEDRFMTEGDQSLILPTLDDSNQMTNNYFFKVSNKDNGLI